MNTTIGENIKTMRRKCGFTQEELALRLGVTPQAISKWENGGGTPDISQLIVELSERCTVLLPRIEGDSMNFYEYNPDRLSAGAFGIMEPVDGTAVSPSEIDAMVVPGLAFTVAGQRMGRGRGYYDKYLSLMGFRAYKIGVCYSEQLFDMLPCEPHDIIMDKVVAG